MLLYFLWPAEGVQSPSDAVYDSSELLLLLLQTKAKHKQEKIRMEDTHEKTYLPLVLDVHFTNNFRKSTTISYLLLYTALIKLS